MNALAAIMKLSLKDCSRSFQMLNTFPRWLEIQWLLQCRNPITIEISSSETGNSSDSAKDSRNDVVKALPDWKSRVHCMPFGIRIQVNGGSSLWRLSWSRSKSRSTIMLTLMGELVPSCPTLRFLPVGVISCSSVIESEMRPFNWPRERKVCSGTIR